VQGYAPLSIPFLCLKDEPVETTVRSGRSDNSTPGQFRDYNQRDLLGNCPWVAPEEVTIVCPGASESQHSITHRKPGAHLGTDQKVCRLALNGGQTDWQALGFKDYVNVAKRRGLSVSDCRRVLRGAVASEDGERAAAPSDPTARQRGFADCFDNPQKCK
jgi:hypothetical protein